MSSAGPHFSVNAFYLVNSVYESPIVRAIPNDKRAKAKAKNKTTTRNIG
jgi:hypothetical protein